MTSAVEDWLAGGQTSVMLITSSLAYQDRTDPEYVRELTHLLEGMTACEMGIALAWMARIAGQAMVDRHDGSQAAADADLREMGRMLAVALAATAPS